MSIFTRDPLTQHVLPSLIRGALVLGLVGIGSMTAHAQAGDSLPSPGSVSALPAKPSDCPDASAELKAQLGELRSLSASFRQQISSADGHLIQDMEGEMQLAKPGLIRWRTLPPFEQELVADGRRIWLYDPDLEQVSVKPVGDSLSGSPAALLLEDLTGLGEQYQVCRLENRPMPQGLSISLKPLQEQSVYSQIVLSFADHRPTSITMYDRLGQTSLVILSDVQLNPEFDSALFTFEVPEGVDIFQDQ